MKKSNQQSSSSLSEKRAAILGERLKKKQEQLDNSQKHIKSLGRQLDKYKEMIFKLKRKLEDTEEGNTQLRGIMNTLMSVKLGQYPQV